MTEQELIQALSASLPEERMMREVAFINKHGIRVLGKADPDYPQRLKGCPDAPAILYAKGNVRPNEGKMISIVGTRNATPRGKDMTRRLVLDLLAFCPDVTIISGLAFGIDVAAHRAALEAGGRTIIIPAHGLDRIYPSIHRDVAIQALQEGGLLTEYPSGTEPERWNFVARNRIVAGMADAVVVVESKAKGGSLITAHIAETYQRPIFAFPGRPQDETSKGCNDLIRQHQAALIEEAADLIRALGWTTKTQPQQLSLSPLLEDLDPTEMAIMQQLQKTPENVSVNDLVMATGIEYAALSAALGILELKDLIQLLPGGLCRRKE